MAGDLLESLFKERIEFHRARKPFSFAGSGSPDAGFHLETLNPSLPEPPGAAAPSLVAGKRSDGRECLEYGGLDLELNFTMSFQRIGAGLENLGNTCYLNSVLQCLTYTEPFVAYLQSGKHKTSCRTAGFCAMCAIQNHVRIALQSSGKIVSPSPLVKNLRCISRNFRNFRQEDAHEYMINLLESMHKCCLPSGVPSQSQSAYEKSLVHKIFGGRLRSQVKCLQCSYCSDTFDPFLDLSLEISKTDSVLKALERFTAVEQLDGGAKQYQCQRCKVKVRAQKQLTVDKAPYVLTIHLKRFESHMPQLKIDKKVHFEPTLNMKPFVSGPYDDLKYTLYGVLVHAGWSTHSGHYYCFVRTSHGLWYSLDDNRVRQVKERDVLNEKAYMLFYVRNRNLISRKPSVAVCKENNTGNMIGTSRLISGSHLGKTNQNVLLERRLMTVAHNATISAAECSISQIQMVSSGKHSSENPSLKNASIPQINGQIVPEELQELALPRPSALISLSRSDPAIAALAEHLQSKKVSASQTIGHIEDFKRSVPSEVPKYETSSGHHTSKSSASERSLKSSVSEGSLVQETGNVQSDNHLGENGLPAPPKENGCAIDSLSRAPKVDGTDCACLPAQTNTCNILPETGPDELSCLRGSEGDQKLVEVRSIELSNHCGNPKSDAPMGPSGKPNVNELNILHPTEVKLKKRVKGPSRSVPFGHKKLFLASLSLRKRKKHKHGKQKHVDVGNHKKINLLDNSILRDQDPSTSKTTKMVQMKRNGLGLNKGEVFQAAESINYCVGDSLCTKEKDAGQSSSKGSFMSVDKSKGRLEKQCDARESGGHEKMASSERGMISMLMRGLEEATVARWDDVDLPSCPLREPSNTNDGSLGYVLDEWDEEYDRGKRKKVKGPHDPISGWNPFQEIASMKAQRKRIKTDRVSYRDQPFRI
ncbi:Ubiquitin carboxyl-terminal hydrolase 23 [Acorus calamus]|uniref:Ubiquitin carboxyl-terminal hydrolase n=1 Tax=Acorus calamus TaxID=4465 RepID=A0AAV9CQV4_ACOCL|nr:Ubiquitin carboxyl-terminal hydrolase 23 [Acorus calamus]